MTLIRSVHSVRGGIQRVSPAAGWIGRQTVWKISLVGADIVEIVGGPHSIFKVPALDRQIDFGFVLSVGFLLGRRIRSGDVGNNDYGDNSKDRHDSQEFEQRKSAGFAGPIFAANLHIFFPQKVNETSRRRVLPKPDL